MATTVGRLVSLVVPALFSGLAGSRAALLGAASYLLVALTSSAGVVATFVWWRRADHTT